MNKQKSVLATCVTGGLVCGIASATFSQENFPIRSLTKGHQEAVALKVSHLRDSGGIPTVQSSELAVQARTSEVPKTSSAIASLGAADSLTAKSGVTLVGSTGDTAKAAARGLEGSWTVAASQMAGLDRQPVDVAPLARAVNGPVATEASINPDVLSQPRLGN